MILIACAQPERRIEPDNLVWPPAPETPRIKYVQSIFTEDDIGREYTFREKLFGKGYFDGLIRPYGISVQNGKIYVSDLLLRQVIIFDQVRGTRSPFATEGAATIPAAVATAKNGDIFIADSGGTKIFQFDARGTYKTAYLIEGGRPVGLALNEALGRLYVVDRARHCVVVLRLDGTRLFEFGGRGIDDGKLNHPLDIAIDRQGTVYVLDSGNFRVQIFSPDGVFQHRFGSVGDRPGMFANPKGIAVDSEGHIYVTDAAFSNFQIFDREGNILLFVGELGITPGYLNMPGQIFIDELDRIYIADQFNSRIQVFQYLKASSP